MRANKKISLGLALALTLSLTTPALAAPAPTPQAASKVVCATNGRSPFSDVPSNHWGIDGIIAAYNDGVMTGTYINQSTGERKFSPNASLTTAEWSVMLYRAFYADEPFSTEKVNWWNREQAVLRAHGIMGYVADTEANGPATRFEMAATIANLLVDKKVSVDAAKVAAAKTQIADFGTIYPMHQDAVATCWALGIIKGVGGNRFDGNSYMNRAAAATVYLCAKNVLNGASTGDDKPPVPTTPPSVSPVGTMSSTPMTIWTNYNEFLKTHAPVVDYWAQQSMEIRNISDRDAFNAACQTIHDSKMIMTQGEFKGSYNIYYNYAVIPETGTMTQKNVDGAMGALGGYGGNYSLGGGGTYKVYYIVPLRTATTSAPRFAATIAQIKANPGMSDMEKARLCVKAVCDQIDYALNGGASWDNGKPTGDCQSYGTMLNQILSGAGIPNLYVIGDTKNGNHQWVQAKLDGQWYVLDATMAETGFSNGGIMSFADHESNWKYSGYNDSDMYKVARALIDTAYPTDFAL